MPDDSIITKPQDFIITLNKLLQTCETKLFDSTPEILVRFLFRELAYFLCKIIIHLIPKIKGGKINYIGYKQLWRNIFSLQQNLTTICQKSMDGCFDRAQKYLELTQKSPREVEVLMIVEHFDGKNKKVAYKLKHNREKSYYFSQPEYIAVKNVAKLSFAHQRK